MDQASQQHQLYQQTLLMHHKNPIGFNGTIQATHQACGENAVCGDEIIVEILVVKNVIQQVVFSGESCAICRASASLLCEQINTLPLAKVKEMIVDLTASIVNKRPFMDVFLPLAALTKYPVRQQCALLPWQTLQKIMSEII